MKIKINRNRIKYTIIVALAIVSLYFVGSILIQMGISLDENLSLSETNEIISFDLWALVGLQIVNAIIALFPDISKVVDDGVL